MIRPWSEELSQLVFLYQLQLEVGISLGWLSRTSVPVPEWVEPWSIYGAQRVEPLRGFHMLGLSYPPKQEYESLLLSKCQDDFKLDQCIPRLYSHTRGHYGQCAFPRK